jgi:hypothetical protein
VSPVALSLRTWLFKAASAPIRFGCSTKQAPDAIDYAKFYSRSHDAVIRVCDEAGNVIETH